MTLCPAPENIKTKLLSSGVLTISPPGDTRAAMTRYAWVWLGLWLAALALAASPAAAQVLFTVDVPPRKWKTVRLRNLPEEAVVAVRVQASGEVIVAFISAEDYRSYPGVKRPLFVGRVQRRFSFSVRTPAAGTYFIVFDNRAGNEPRAITVTVHASRQKERAVPPQKLPPF
jgi:hypothetical protein